MQHKGSSPQVASSAVRPVKPVVLKGHRHRWIPVMRWEFAAWWHVGAAKNWKNGWPNGPRQFHEGISPLGFFAHFLIGRLTSDCPQIQLIFHHPLMSNESFLFFCQLSSVALFYGHMLGSLL